MPSDLQVSNIRDQANANSAITIASDGQITVNQNNPTLTLGSNASGFTGIKTVDVWHLKQNISGNQAPIEAQYFQRGTASMGGANLGTGISLNGSGSDDGIFTFPSTGIWRVEGKWNFELNGDARYIFAEIKVSTTGTGGTFTSRSMGKAFIQQTQSSTTNTSCYDTLILDVTTSGTSGTAIQIDMSMAGTATINGGTTSMSSFLVFTRLGDT